MLLMHALFDADLCVWWSSTPRVVSLKGALIRSRQPGLPRSQLRTMNPTAKRNRCILCRSHGALLRYAVCVHKSLRIWSCCAPVQLFPLGGEGASSIWTKALLATASNAQIIGNVMLVRCRTLAMQQSFSMVRLYPRGNCESRSRQGTASFLLVSYWSRDLPSVSLCLLPSLLPHLSRNRRKYFPFIITLTPRAMRSASVCDSLIEDSTMPMILLGNHVHGRFQHHEVYRACPDVNDRKCCRHEEKNKSIL